MSNYLFVYGTLRRNSRHPMARRLAAIARHVGAAQIAGRLYHLGRFPGLNKPRSAADWVQGDVYELGAHPEATLAEMDAYENAESPPPTPYERQLAPVQLGDRELAAWVYWYRGDVREEQFIASGCWIQASQLADSAS